MRSLRVGVVGTGGIVRHGIVRHGHLPGLLAAGAHLISVAGRNDQRRAGLAVDCHPRDWQDPVSDTGSDAVTIAPPNASHAARCLAALQTGKHVLCEKPLAIGRPEVDVIVATASRAGRVRSCTADAPSPEHLAEAGRGGALDLAQSTTGRRPA